MGEMIRQGATDTSISVQELGNTLAQVADAMRGMMEMMRATNERMSALESQVRLLTKVTPAQVSAINAAMRERAKELCELYRMTGSEKGVTNAIRKELKLLSGVSSVKELPRCEYQLMLERVRAWEDYKVLKKIKSAR